MPGESKADPELRAMFETMLVECLRRISDRLPPPVGVTVILWDRTGTHVTAGSVAAADEIHTKEVIATMEAMLGRLRDGPEHKSVPGWGHRGRN